MNLGEIVYWMRASLEILSIRLRRVR